MVPDRCRGDGLLRAVCGDLFGGSLLHAADLSPQRLDLRVAGGFADGDGFPGGDVLLDARGDALFALARLLAAGAKSIA
ncbi:hypothetical protein ABZV58_23140 [Nocardia sp. NPDC004654]|uniref:hypothetical protein n=1 Tax=Nocardia sp. NPDC004654 TaxID=3154776 RepID=UPI0033A1E60F